MTQYNPICISSGHGKYIRGASGYLDEVDEARRVVEHVSDILHTAGVEVMTFHDDTSRDQNTNLNTIVNWHNGKNRALDVSVHFNAYQTTQNPMGTECLYITQAALAAAVSRGVADATRLPDRGGKKRTDLFFLNNTEEPAILIEVVFVDSKADANAYHANFDKLCYSIATVVAGKCLGPIEPPKPVDPPSIPSIPSRPPGPPIDR